MDRQTKLDVLQNVMGRKWWDKPKPVILSDVLVWGKTRQSGAEYTDKLWINCTKDGLDHLINRDLTKPYLSEQSDETVDGILEVVLLTKKD